MKKQLIKKLLAPLGKGLFIFALFGLALYAHAIAFPGTQPNAVTGVVGMFVGVTEMTFEASSNYATVNSYCKTGDVVIDEEAQENVGAHICTATELVNSYNNNNAAINAQAGIALINNGPPGYLAYSNDCMGWSNISGEASGYDVYGAYWDFENKYGLVGNCGGLVSVGYPFACCK